MEKDVIGGDFLQVVVSFLVKVENDYVGNWDPNEIGVVDAST